MTQAAILDALRDGGVLQDAPRGAHVGAGYGSCGLVLLHDGRAACVGSWSRGVGGSFVGLTDLDGQHFELTVSEANSLPRVGRVETSSQWPGWWRGMADATPERALDAALRVR